MFIADTFITIKDHEGKFVEMSHIEELDRMLNRAGINHCFSLPIEKDKDGHAHDDHVVCLGYDASESGLAADLVVALWGKTVMGYSDKLIRKACAKIASKSEED